MNISEKMDITKEEDLCAICLDEIDSKPNMSLPCEY